MSRITKFIKAALFARDQNAWEAVCDQCGECCYERTIFDHGEVQVDKSSPCEFLDETTKKCTVYENRFKICDRCHKVTPYQVTCTDNMPPNCAYVRKFNH